MMSYRPGTIGGAWLLAIFGTVLGLAGEARAQLSVEMKLGKDAYVAYEPMKAKVLVFNRSGRDVVLGGPGGSSWLRFQVRGYKGNLLSAGRRKLEEEPMLVKAGAKIERTVDLATYYPVHTYGTYRLNAAVYYPPADRFYESAQKTISVADGKTIWDDTVGAPGGGTTRRFSLLTYRSKNETELYVRIVDENTGGVYATYSLGACILFHMPQAAVDSQGSLHVLFMGAPTVYGHCIVGYNGNFIKRDVYKATGANRPKLMMASGGRVSVEGGYMDSGPGMAARGPDGAGPGAGAAPPPVRRMSEKPPLPGQ